MAGCTFFGWGEKSKPNCATTIGQGRENPGFTCTRRLKPKCPVKQCGPRTRTANQLINLAQPQDPTRASWRLRCCSKLIACLGPETAFQKAARARAPGYQKTLVSPGTGSKVQKRFINSPQISENCICSWAACMVFKDPSARCS